MSSSHTVSKYLRLIHLYTGVFIAPALLFFAFTGALQTFSLHETTRGSTYKPPAWAVMLAQIHKKQTPIVPIRKAPPPDKPADKATQNNSVQDKPQSPAAASQSTPSAALKPLPDALPMKCFFLLVSIGLFVSTSLWPLHVLQVHSQQAADHRHTPRRHHRACSADDLLTPPQQENQRHHSRQSTSK